MKAATTGPVLLLLVVGHLDSLPETIVGGTVGPLFPRDNHRVIAEVAPAVPRRVGQRDEHLFVSAAVLPDVVLDDGVLPVQLYSSLSRS